MKSFVTTLGLCLAVQLNTLPSLHAQGTSAEETVATLVRELPFTEVYNGLLFHDNHLWLGVSRRSKDERHKVEVYNSDAQLIRTIELPHAVQEIYAHGPHEVLVLGKSAEPYWTGYFTIIPTNSLRPKTTKLPIEYIFEDFAYSATKGLFFNEPGSRGIYAVSGGRIKKFGPDISGPGAMVITEDSLWVIERRSIFHDGDEDIARIDFTTDKVTRPFSENRQGLHGLTYIASSNLIAVTESLKNQILFIDPVTNNEVGTVKVNGEPKELITIGKCVASISPQNKLVSVAITQPHPALLTEIDLQIAGDRLKLPRAIAYDANTQTFYARSAYVCSSCTVSQSSVFAFKNISATAAITEHCY